MKTDGGKWTVFQRRQDATVNFFRTWRDYKKGFGDANGNFWIGLDIIHLLTKSGQHVLRVDLMDASNNTAYAKYGNFKVASESKAYKLYWGLYSGKYNQENITPSPVARSPALATRRFEQQERILFSKN